MTTPNDPAFPVPPDSGFMDGNAGWRTLPASSGLTKREEFAKAIMAGMAASTHWEQNFDRANGSCLPEAAKTAVAAADALIAALNPPHATKP